MMMLVLGMGGLIIFFFLPIYFIYFVYRMIQAHRAGVPWEQYKRWWE